ncbi:hypothetical protein BC832DRAFT_550660 [Gaertneriomyces semiglobifer]|nr:hypothetical protein BC832DRAFT_550660 [Gaertneriomyces semiglobifer]
MQDLRSFDDLVTELMFEPTARRSRSDAVISQDLLSLKYPLRTGIRIENIRKLVLYGKSHWNSTATFPNFVEVLFQLFSKQKILYSSSDVHNTVVLDCVDILLKALQAATPAIPYQDDRDWRLPILKTLGTVLFENGPACHKFYTVLLDVLAPLASNDPKPGAADVCRMAITCLGNLVVKTGSRGSSLQKEVSEILFSNLGSGNATDEEYMKVLTSTLRGLQLLVNENKSVVENAIPILLPIILKYGVQAVSQNSVLSTASRKKTLRQPLKRVQSALPSDSEFSDGETALSRQRNREYRLQINALLCVQALAKAQAKLMYSEWFKFLPDPIDGPSAPSLISVMRDSEYPRVRHAACAALTSFLEGSKQYLSVAEDRPAKSSFITLSQKLAAQLREIHEGLLDLITQETQPVLISQELKCLSVLIRSTPYDRLSRDFRSECYRVVLSRLRSEDFGITSSCLDCVSALFDAGLSIETVDAATSPMKILIDFTRSGEHISVRMGALDVFCAVARNRLDLIRNHWQEMLIELDSCAKDPKEAIRAAALKFLEQYTHSRSELAATPQPSDMDWWCEMLDRYIPVGTQDPFYAVRALACDCMSHIPAAIFEQMPAKRQYGCYAVALGLLQDEDYNVRASACGALGAYVMMPSAIDDVLFLADVASSLPAAMEDPNLSVRIRGSWAIANLCDAFARISEKNDTVDVLVTEGGVTTDVYVQLMRTGVAAAKDNDKCRSNGVRALGNIIRACPKSVLAAERERAIKNAVEAVLKNVDSGSVKTRWNSCHALTNMLRVTGFPIGTASYTASVYNALTKALNSKNFKVRISAAAALAAPKTLTCYGRDEQDATTRIVNLIEVLARGWESVDDLAEVKFGEVKHRESLRHQLDTTFKHLKHLVPNLQNPKITQLCQVFGGKDVH